VKLALDLNILFAIFAEPPKPFFVIKPVNASGIFTLPSSPRLTHLVHQPFAREVLAVLELECVRDCPQPRRKPDG
jgi:hypothetical protein